jgi:hypothetical protein
MRTIGPNTTALVSPASIAPVKLVSQASPMPPRFAFSSSNVFSMVAKLTRQSSPAGCSRASHALIC